jgi:hypothetical protein
VVVAAPKPEPPQSPVELPAGVYQRRLSYPHDESQLRWLLAQTARDLDIESEKGTIAKVMQDADKGSGSAEEPAPKSPVLKLLAERTDLKGLPVRKLSECQITAKEANAIRQAMADFPSDDLRRRRQELSTSYSNRGNELAEFFDKKLLKADESRDAGVRIMMQVVQREGPIDRINVIGLLKDVKEKSASDALAHLAVFDFGQDIREKAVAALRTRPPAEYRQVLLEALRHPWPPVAEHAAEALVGVDDRDAAFELAGLVDKPDPARPTKKKDGKWTAPELVRVNHLANCVLCHAPSDSRRDPMRGAVPKRGEALPVEYYDGGEAGFVRADVTYLRQDFSLMIVVPEPDKWPALQRFDFLIRQRELTEKECADLPAQDSYDADQTYPQREAALWALRKLTRHDAGSRTADWMRYLYFDHLIGP